jgi:hypothetical protein
MIYNIDRYDPEVLMQSQDVTERQESDLTSADLSAVTDDAQFREVLSAAAEGGPIWSNAGRGATTPSRRLWACPPDSQDLQCTNAWVAPSPFCGADKVCWLPCAASSTGA